MDKAAKSLQKVHSLEKTTVLCQSISTYKSMERSDHPPLATNGPLFTPLAAGQNFHFNFILLCDANGSGGGCSNSRMSGEYFGFSPARNIIPVTAYIPI